MASLIADTCLGAYLIVQQLAKRINWNHMSSIWPCGKDRY